jgi:hypothetical protein
MLEYPRWRLDINPINPALVRADKPNMSVGFHGNDHHISGSLQAQVPLDDASVW